MKRRRDVEAVLQHHQPVETVWNALLQAKWSLTLADLEYPGFASRSNRLSSDFLRSVYKKKCELLTYITNLLPIASLKQDCQDELEQLMKLVEALPNHALRIAVEFLNTEVNQSIEVLRLNNYFEAEATWSYLFATLSAGGAGQKKGAKAAQTGSYLGVFGTSGQLDAAVAAIGGWRQVQAYALCQTVMSDVMCYFAFVTGREESTDSTGWVSRPFWRQIAAIDSLWIQKFEGINKLILDHSPNVQTALDYFYQDAKKKWDSLEMVHIALGEEKRLSELSRAEANQLRKQVTDLKQKITAFSSETVSARKHASELQVLNNNAKQEVENLRTKVRNLTDYSTRMLKESEPSRSISIAEQLGWTQSREGTLDTFIAAEKSENTVNELRIKCDELELQLYEVDQQVKTLRQFTNLLLTFPREGLPRESAAPSDSKVPIADMKVIVVGGHERMHSKLRKALPNGVFFHPDKSQFSADVFNTADCVLFAVDYCSHALTWRAAQELRKRSIPAGYTSHVNVEMVLEDVREILSQHSSWITK